MNKRKVRDKDVRLLQDPDDMLGQYRQFYPDATMTEITSVDGSYYLDEEVYSVVMKLCRITHTMALYINVSRNKIKVIKSAEFLKNTDKMMKKGCKVRFCDPRIPTDETEGIVTRDNGIHYEGGAAVLHIECKQRGLVDLDMTYALFWRPIEG